MPRRLPLAEIRRDGPFKLVLTIFLDLDPPPFSFDPLETCVLLRLPYYLMISSVMAEDAIDISGHIEGFEWLIKVAKADAAEYNKIYSGLSACGLSGFFPPC